MAMRDAKRKGPVYSAWGAIVAVVQNLQRKGSTGQCESHFISVYYRRQDKLAMSTRELYRLV